MAKINFVTNPGDIKKILGKDRAILLLAIDLEGISLDDLKHWLTSLTGGEENTAYKKFCASMNLQPQEKKNRDFLIVWLGFRLQACKDSARNVEIGGCSMKLAFIRWPISVANGLTTLWRFTANLPSEGSNNWGRGRSKI